MKKLLTLGTLILSLTALSQESQLDSRPESLFDQKTTVTTTKETPAKTTKLTKGEFRKAQLTKVKTNRETLKTKRDDLNKLIDAEKPDWVAIKKLSKEIANIEAENKVANLRVKHSKLSAKNRVEKNNQTTN